MSFTYTYARPALAVDAVVLGFDPDSAKPPMEVLLVERALPPFEGTWALPGGFVLMNETIAEAARRELAEETGLTNVFLEELGSFSAVDRDPRERVVSIAHFALVRLSDHRVRAATDARDARWFPIGELPSLAFDHGAITRAAIDRLRFKVRHEPIGFELLPAKFTLSQLQRLYEAVLDEPIDKRNFRKKVLAMDLVEPLDEVEQGVSHRAAQLYRFHKRKYELLKKKGFEFDL